MRKASLSQQEGIRTTRRNVLKGAGIGGVTGVSFTAGCLGQGGGGDSDGIVIGSILPLTGAFSAWGISHLEGLEFAIDEINADGGVLGEQIEVSYTDTEANPTEAATQFRQLVERDNAVAITGPTSSDVTLRATQNAEEMEVPVYLNMGSTHRALTKESRYTFRVGLVPSPTMVRAGIDLVEEFEFSSVGTILGDYEAGHAIDESIDQLWPENVNVDIQFAPVGESDFSPYIRNMDENVDMVNLMGHPPGSNSIARQMEEIGVNPEFTTGGFYPPDVLYDAQGAEVLNAVNTRHMHLTDVYSDEYLELANRYHEETGDRMTSYKAYGYIAGNLIAEAIENGGSADPSDISEQMRNHQFDSLYANPIEYTEWGELDNIVFFFSEFEMEPPEYYPEGEWRLNETHRTSPIPAYDPDELSL